MTDVARCSACQGRIIYGRTPARKLMPLEYDRRNIPAGTVLNVAYFRHSSARVDCIVLTKAQAAAASAGTPLETVLPDVVNAEFYTLTVAHFTTCPAAVAHRDARRGDVDGVRPMPRRTSAGPARDDLAPVIPLRRRPR